MDHRQSQAGAFTFFFRGEIGIENAFHIFGRDAMAGVLNRQFDIGALLDTAAPGRPVSVDRDIDQVDFQGAAAFPHGMMGVGAEVHHNLMDLDGVGFNHGIVVQIASLDFNRGGQRGAYQFEHFLDDQVDLNRLFFLLALTTERENLVDQTFGTLAGRENIVQRLAGILALTGMNTGDFRVSENGLKDIVEVVGNAAGQRSDGFHFLGLPQLRAEFGFFFFGLDPIGNITGNGQHGWMIVVLDGPAAGFNRYDGVIIGFERRFEDDVVQPAEFIHALRPEGRVLGGDNVHGRFFEHIMTI